MKALILLLTITLPALAETPRGLLRCTATFRGLTDRDDSFEKNAALAPVGSPAGSLRLSARIDDRLFLVTEQLRGGDLFAQILNAGTGAQGSTARGAADSLGRFSAAEVAGASVYRIDCQRR